MNRKEMRELDYWLFQNIPGLRSNSRPTRDPSATMLVLEKCAARNVSIMIQPVGNMWACETEIANTIPLAICLFCKKLFEKGQQ